VEVRRLEATLSRITGPEEGTGGSGVNLESYPVASTVVVGRVSAVRRGAVEVMDRETNSPYLLALSDSTRVLRDGERVSVRQLREGARVRASVDLVGGDTVARRVEVLERR